MTKLLTTLLVLLSLNSMGQGKVFDFSEMKFTKTDDDIHSLIHFNSTPKVSIYSVAVKFNRIIVTMDNIKYTIHYTGTIDSMNDGKNMYIPPKKPRND